MEKIIMKARSVGMSTLASRLLKCDRCGNTTWEKPSNHPGAFPMIEKVFGKDILLCAQCGAVRYPHEVDGSESEANEAI